CDVTSQNGKLTGMTDIFIYPDYRFKAVDSLITNFHLPGSTPLLLASALCGWENLMKTYKEAIARRYRFFSYGDAMLIV
ncbi:MAG: S-adenosylmethionine:tRNA ribosyltransferase-isomerase, partial [Nitrospirae bacterium]|nr:S-adenosylmethionine:tRNA ribosyltransferase-isomerase [Nitrospirota bacterium]